MIHNWKIASVKELGYYVTDGDGNYLWADGSAMRGATNNHIDIYACGWYRTEAEARQAIINYGELHCTDTELRIPERFRKFVRSERFGSSAVFEEFVSRLEDKKDEGLRNGCDTHGVESNDPKGPSAIPAEQQSGVPTVSCQPSAGADDSKTVEGVRSVTYVVLGGKEGED